MADLFQKTKLGRTRLKLGRLGLGTAPLASIFWGNDAATARLTASRSLERGIRFFDTAPFYGLGESERRLGRSLAERTGGSAVEGVTARGEIVIATKAGRLLETEPDGSIEARFDFGYDATMRSLESSLERLGSDRVDIVHIHDPDDHLNEALAGTHRALLALRDQGVIAAVSLGTNRVETAAVFLERADLDCILVAGRYTLLDQTAAALIDACAGRGVAYLAAGVFNSGVLARPHPEAWFDYGPVSSEHLNRAIAIEAVCSRHGVTLAAAALNFPLANPSVSSIIVGMAAPGEVDANIAAIAADVPGELWQELTAAGLIQDPVP